MFDFETGQIIAAETYPDPDKEGLESGAGGILLELLSLRLLLSPLVEEVLVTLISPDEPPFSTTLVDAGLGFFLGLGANALSPFCTKEIAFCMCASDACKRVMQRLVAALGTSWEDASSNLVVLSTGYSAVFVMLGKLLP